MSSRYTRPRRGSATLVFIRHLLLPIVVIYLACFGDDGGFIGDLHDTYVVAPMASLSQDVQSAIDDAALTASS